jgi:hypothetical protein
MMGIPKCVFASQVRINLFKKVVFVKIYLCEVTYLFLSKRLLIEESEN